MRLFNGFTDGLGATIFVVGRVAHYLLGDQVTFSARFERDQAKYARNLLTSVLNLLGALVHVRSDRAFATAVTVGHRKYVDIFYTCDTCLLSTFFHFYATDRVKNKLWL